MNKSIKKIGNLIINECIDENENDYVVVEGFKVMDAVSGNFCTNSELAKLLEVYRLVEDIELYSAIETICKNNNVDFESYVDWSQDTPTYYFDFDVVEFKKAINNELESIFCYELDDNIAIHESKDSEKVVEFKKGRFFTFEYLYANSNHDVYGVYYDDNNEIVARINGNYIMEYIIK